MPSAVSAAPVFLFGPVFSYDMLRIGRRRLNFLYRTLYAVLIGLTVAWIYYFEAEVHSAGQNTSSINQQSRIGEIIFTAFITVQFCGILLLAPGYTAGAISEEKERKTLEFLLATDLRPREIVFGKFLSRVAYLMLFVLAGLPVLSLIQLFGGIDPETLLMAYGVTLISIVSASAVSILASVLARRARDAIALSYLAIVGYILLSFGLFLLGRLLRGEGSFGIFGYRISSVEIGGECCDGNIFYGVAAYAELIRSPGGGALVADLFRRYLLFHAGAIVLCVGYAIWILRSTALSQLFGKVPGSSGKGRKARKRRTVGNYPMVWKETLVERARPALLARIVAVILVISSFAPIFFYVGPFDNRGNSNFPEFMNGYCRVAGAVVCSLVFLSIAVRGANAIRGEKDRQTFDDLLTTPLTTREILIGKWAGCVFGLRRGWLWVGAIWALGLVTTGVHPLAIPPLIAAALIYASGFAWIGILCSISCTTSLKATLWSIIAALFAGGGYFIAFACCCFWPLAVTAGGRGADMEILSKFLVGICAPFDIGYLAFREAAPDGATRYNDKWEDLPYFIFLGTLFWGILSYVLAQTCINRFDDMTHRSGFGPENRGIL